MNTPIIILFLASAVTTSYAALARFPAEPKPAEFASQEGCYLSSLKRVLPYETPYYPDGKCEQYTCNRNNETVLETCGVVADSPNCQVTYNNQLKYPGCCQPIIVCDQTTVAPTTEATTTTNAPSTTPAPSTPEPQSSYASAYASSQTGSAPVAQASATPGASAVASAS